MVCGPNPSCVNARRRAVAAAFFIENEFQRTGFFIYRFYQAALGRRPTYTEFTADRGQVVGGAEAHRFHSRGDAAVPRQDHDHRGGVEGLDLSHDVEA